MLNMKQPITFEVSEANLSGALQWQKLIEQLMDESDMFTIASMRDGAIEPEQSTGDAITLLLMATQNDIQIPVGIGSVENGEVGLAILQRFHGAGLGQYLLSVLIDWAQQANVSQLWLDVQIDNRTAIHIYEKFGFIVQGGIESMILPNGRPTQLQRMVKDIKSSGKEV